MIKRREQEELREGNIARREFLGEMQDETALHFQDDVGEALGVSAELIVAVGPKLGRRIQTA